MEGRALGEMFDKKELSVVAMIYNSTLIGLSLFIVRKRSDGRRILT